MSRIIIILLLLFSPAFLSSAFYKDTSPANHGEITATKASIVESVVTNLTHNLSKEGESPRKEILQMAVAGYFRLVEEGRIRNGRPLSIIDFDKPSTEKRLWIIDMKNKILKHHSLVAHGRNSGDLMAKKFSNKPSSYMSSLGFYLTGETYKGKHGHSLKLDGLEPGFNDLARPRAIVIHSADYAEESFIKSTGRLGRSLGCPALPTENYEDIIELIKDKSCLFIYADDPAYKNRSEFLQQAI
ncbi:murein L,D-transpeptidase catalytic domain family protein [Negadavirga shengliensis]|uniref:Murein L,D-transpeptidase catalytic domain family protein n=1 Tax=Negadavirga shengliensis TaxID=1389218 RepID=A0ABV9SUM1_9BACT